MSVGFRELCGAGCGAPACPASCPADVRTESPSLMCCWEAYERGVLVPAHGRRRMAER